VGTSGGNVYEKKKKKKKKKKKPTDLAADVTVGFYPVTVRVKPAVKATERSSPG
jgi:hypothetical protein